MNIILQNNTCNKILGVWAQMSFFNWQDMCLKSLEATGIKAVIINNFGILSPVLSSF